MVYTVALCTGMKVGIRARHTRVLVLGMSCMGVYDFELGCMYGIAHREQRTCTVSFLSYTYVRTALGGTP
jgi:hypothetical protein